MALLCDSDDSDDEIRHIQPSPPQQLKAAGDAQILADKCHLSAGV
jgi:hypothetical protein